jgi:hypothetical protein
MTEDFLACVDGIVHEDTQTEGRGIDLTVAGIRRVESPGRIDFGGGELEPAGARPVETEKRDASDDYGWWILDGGRYLLAYNETLDADGTVLLQPREALLEAGASHPTLRVASLPPVPLAVPDAGLRLKENARVSTLLGTDGH